MKWFVNNSIFAALAILLFITTATNAQPDFKAVQQNIADRLGEGNILGVSIAYIYPDGRTQYISRGFNSTERTENVDQNSIFEIGPVTQTFTTLIFVHMASQHKVSLNETIDKILPKSVRAPSYKGRKITLLHLATHTSGLPPMPSNFSPKDTLNPYVDYTRGDLYRFLNQYKLTEAPGSNYQYSHFAVGLLGYLLALAADQPYEQLLRNYITAPLGMTDTGVMVSGEEANRFVKPYNYGRPVKYWDFAVLKATGAIHSTAADMATYVKAQMGLLNTDFGNIIQMTHHIRFNKGSDNIDAVGLAWMQATKNDTIIYHSGGTGGFYSFVGYNKDKERGVVVLASGKDQIDDIGFHLLDKRYPLKQPQPLEKKELITPGITILNNYTGTYLTANGLKYYVFRRDNQLRVQLAGKTSQQVFAKSNHRFFFKNSPAEIEFSNETSSSQTFTLYKNGRKIVAHRTNNHKIKSKAETTNGYSSLLKQYEGVFKIDVGYYITITKEGDQLMAQPTGEGKIFAKSTSKNEFLLKSINAKIEFIKNENGAFNKLKIYQSGRIFIATRL